MRNKLLFVCKKQSVVLLLQQPGWTETASPLTCKVPAAEVSGGKGLSPGSRTAVSLL